MLDDPDLKDQKPPQSRAKAGTRTGRIVHVYEAGAKAAKNCSMLVVDINRSSTFSPRR
jgi:hypothetical protein